MKTENEELIEAKEKEIQHYVGVMERSQGSRWFDQGTRRMAVLKAELQALHDAAVSVDDNSLISYDES